MSVEKKTFTVLFYKRTNKVHKSKGVAKIDGTLTIDPNNGSLVLRDASTNEDDHSESSSDEEETDKAPRKKKMTWKQQKKKMSKSRGEGTASGCGGIIFSGKNMDVAKKSLHEEDVIVLGGYDVQIVSSHSTTASSTNLAAAPPSAATTQPKQPPRDGTKIGLQSKKPMLPLKRKAAPLLSKRLPMTGTSQAANLAGSNVSTAASKTVGGAAAAGVPLASAVYNNKPIIKQAALSGAKAVLTSKTLNKNPIGQPATSSLKRRAVPSSSRSISMSKNHHGPIQAAAAPAAPLASVLPHIPLPASIRSTLRPHQVTGVDFIWRCLTGDVRGAILGDEVRRDSTSSLNTVA
jgi:DNA repair and recombination protein RAD54 and RAD54-like protein